MDVGSYDVNGSYKSLFKDERYDYIGLDMEAGPNVDIVLKNPYDWKEIKTDSYDIVISGQAFEHIEFFWITMSEMARVLKKDGLLCILVPNNQVEHRFPVDCYRYFSDGLVALARYVCLEPIHAHTNCSPVANNPDWYSVNQADTMLIAKKSYEGNVKYVNLETYVCLPPDQETLRSGFFPYKPKHKRLIKKLLKWVNQLS